MHGQQNIKISQVFQANGRRRLKICISNCPTNLNWTLLIENGRRHNWSCFSPWM